MGSHYSALLLMEFPQEIDLADVVKQLMQHKYELASEETYHPAMPLSIGCVSICKFKKIIFLQGEVLFGRNCESELMQCLKQLSAQGRLFHWTVEDTSGALDFDYLEYGITRRSWWSNDVRVSLNTGVPLPGEPPGKFGNSLSADNDEVADEWDVVSVAEGFGFVWDELDGAPCSVYRPAGSAKPSGSVAGQKPWWRCW